MVESLGELWRDARRNPITLSGFALLLVLVLVALFAPLLAPYSPDYTNANNALQTPTRQHLFGTGVFGEDIFSRVLFGARYDLGIALGAVGIGFTCGCTVGAIAGYIGRLTDELLMRFMAILEPFPRFILPIPAPAPLA